MLLLFLLIGNQYYWTSINKFCSELSSRWFNISTVSTLCHWAVLYLDHCVIFRALSILPTILATPSGVSTTSRTALSSTSLPSTSPDDSGNTSRTGSSESNTVGLIAGGVIGVVVLVIVTIIAIILWRWRSLKFIATNQTEEVPPKAVPEARLGSVQHFVLHPSNASPVDTSGPNSAPYTLSPVIGTANQAGLLPKKSAHGHRRPVDTRDASLWQFPFPPHRLWQNASKKLWLWMMRDSRAHWHWTWKLKLIPRDN